MVEKKEQTAICPTVGKQVRECFYGVVSGVERGQMSCFGHARCIGYEGTE